MRRRSFRKAKRRYRRSKSVKRRRYARLAKTIQRISGVEVKYTNYNIPAQVVGSGWTSLTANNKGILGSAVQQGVQNNQMIGNNLYWRKCLIEMEVGFDGTNANQTGTPVTNCLPWMYRVLVIKPYNLTDLLTNFNAISNARLPANINSPVDFQTGKIVYDRTFKLSPDSTFALSNQCAFDQALPTLKRHMLKFNIFKEYFCDPGSNVWSKDMCVFVYSNQIPSWKNIVIQCNHTIFYTDS